MRTKVIFEDKDIIVIHKPAGIAVQTARIGQQDVVSELKNYLAGKTFDNAAGKTIGNTLGKTTDKTSGKPTGKPTGASAVNSPYLGVIHRLDQPVEGVLVFAKNPKAAAALSKQMQGGDFCKEYMAVVCGKAPKTEENLVDYLKKDGDKALVYNAEKPSNGKENAAEKHASDPEAKKAVLHYTLLEEKCIEETSIEEKCVAENHVANNETEDRATKDKATKDKTAKDNQVENNAATYLSLLRVQLETGRFHQIRAQLSNAGMPILADAKYGNEISNQMARNLRVRNVALCAVRLTFTHPITGKNMEYTITPENPAFTLFVKQE